MARPRRKTRPTQSPSQPTLELHPAQDDFCNDLGHRYCGFVGGIGSGKSFAGALKLLLHAKPRRLYMAIAPTYPMMRDSTLRTFMQLVEECRWLDRPFAKGDMLATLRNGAEILFRSCDDPERLRGPNLSGVWLDEASLMDRGVYDVAIGRLREGGERGRLDATFTPKGKRHWTYEIFGTPGRPETALFHASTASNPFLPAGFEANLQIQYGPTRAAQELGGQFVDIEGAEWPMDYFGPHIWFDDWPPASNFVARAMALDPSKGKDAKSGDYSAFVWGAETPDGTLWVDADLERRPVAKIIEDTFRLIAAFPVDGFAVESNQFQELLADDMLRLSQSRGVVLPMYKFNNYVNKKVRIRRCGSRLAQRRIRFKANSPGARLLVDQLMAFGEDSREHDDGPDCLDQVERLIEILKTGRLERGQQQAVMGVMY